MFAALSPTEYIAEQMVPFALVIFCLFCGAPCSFPIQLSPRLCADEKRGRCLAGVTVPPNDMIGFWRTWMLPLNPFTWVVEGTLVNELHQLEVVVRSTLYFSLLPQWRKAD